MEEFREACFYSWDIPALYCCQLFKKQTGKVL